MVADHSMGQDPVSDALLQIRDLKKRFGRREVVRGVSMEVKAGEVVGLLGRNGAGKTTTFRMIMGMIRPDAGEVMFNRNSIANLPMYRRAKLGIGYLAQEPTIFSRMTVAENIMAVLEMQPDLTKQRRDVLLRDGIDEMGLNHVAESNAEILSGGERRRLEIARVMCINPKILLLDEPFFGVDPIAVGDIRKVIESFNRRGISVLITDHDARTVLETAQRVYIMSEGIIWLSGNSEELVNNPEARSRYLGEDFYIDPKRIRKQKQVDA